MSLPVVLTRTTRKGFTLVEMLLLFTIILAVCSVFGLIFWLTSPSTDASGAVTPSPAAQVKSKVLTPTRTEAPAVTDFVEWDYNTARADAASALQEEVTRLEKLVVSQQRTIDKLEANVRRDQLYSNAEYQVINDESVRRQVVEWIVKHKLDVLPGDVEWLAERIRLDDWGNFETATEAVGHRFRRQLEEFP